MLTVSFKNDIMPLFQQYKARMIWRFDLTDYEDVKGNADLIYAVISNSNGNIMPPPPFAPFSAEQVAMFKAWIDGGYHK